MSSLQIFDYLPLWLIFICLVALVLLSIWIGIAIVRTQKSKQKKLETGHLSTIVGATLGLIAFLLAFTFNLTIERFNERKHYLLEEVNAIETTWLRTQLINEPYRSEIKELLLEFVEVRVKAAKQPEKMDELIKQAHEIETQIWSRVTDLINSAPRKDAINALFVNSVNEMFDMQTKRVTVIHISSIPPLIWLAFFIIVMLSMSGVGVLVGKQEDTDWTSIILLTLSISLVILLIIDLDRSSGIIQINYEPVFDLYQRMLNG